MNRIALATIFATLLLACGGADEGNTASESGAGNEMTSENLAAPTAQKKLAACDGEPGCARSIVLDVLGKDGLMLVGSEYHPTDLFPAREVSAKEVVEAFLARPYTPGTEQEVGISTEPDGSALKITVTMYESSEEGEGSLYFTFTLEGDDIVEESVDAGIAG